MDQAMTATILWQTNRRHVYRYLYDSPCPVTGEEIAEGLELSPDKVTDSLNSLIGEGLVARSGPAPSDGYELIPGARIAAGISIRDDEVSLLAIDLRAKELGCRELSIPFSHVPEYYQTISQNLEQLLDESGLDRDRLLGLGIAVPGIIDQTAGKMVMAPTLELWDVPLEEIYCHFARYPAFIENNPNASGYAEQWADSERTNVVYVSVDRGVGGVIMQGEKQYMGDHGRGGEFGHMRLVPNGRLCHCGRRGCFEAYCSTSRLSDDLGLTLEEFFARLREGDEGAAAAWEEYRNHLTDALANLRTCFDCDIVLGGSLSRHLEGLLPELCWELGEKTLFDGDSFFLHLDHFGPHSACTGTALRFIDDFLLTL